MIFCPRHVKLVQLRHGPAVATTPTSTCPSVGHVPVEASTADGRVGLSQQEERPCVLRVVTSAQQALAAASRSVQEAPAAGLLVTCALALPNCCGACDQFEAFQGIANFLGRI